ncbi:MAG TPA: acyl-CoA dehydrogenase family protein [Stackebrandtia sp.]|jgi:alkylation response protein AidB-like acyl-CoA dehydrogenase|uniref:acyl-CoA dehydrogenase family protein n=1 Tax=Stackebrandtia sp. TaxID=2023065 RepID=UPI002D48BCA2|nr:acyl-CoA dehydrogenase family protein [Stackebrandtia sp.]HZE39843.1 acyl-CoA dehydrogenase family protein [Stackebrandtia sp.]
MLVDRFLPSDEAYAIVDLARRVADAELAPRADDFEARGEFPRDVLRTLGSVGLLGLPYPVELGGGGQPYEVYVQVLEELAYRWLTVAEAVSVHTLACHAVANFGTDEQRGEFLPGLVAGDRLGAYCLTEPGGGSDAAALTTRARRDGDGFVVEGTKAFITHAGVADFYTVFARTGGAGAAGISCFLAEAGEGIAAARGESKMGLSASPTGQVVFDGARVGAGRLIGGEGAGFSIAMSALDAGRLGIAACAVGLARSALDFAVEYARRRRQFGAAVIDFQGVGFLLADASAQVEAARALVVHAARLRDAGAQGAGVMAARAKLVASDVAMRVATDAVQVLGGYGYVSDFPVERWFREAKVLQIVEGTNQIQRLVIARALAKG